MSALSFRERLQLLHDACFAAAIDVHCFALRGRPTWANISKAKTLPRRWVALSAAAFGTLAFAAPSLAGTKCQNPGAGSLLRFVSDAANFLVGIGAGSFVLMVSTGALFIIFGGTADRANKGMQMVRQAVIGLGILAGGIFIKYIVTAFITGVTKKEYGDGGGKCT